VTAHGLKAEVIYLFEEDPFQNLTTDGVDMEITVKRNIVKMSIVLEMIQIWM